ncbi:MAG TPA: tRNA glutamyl-Q(34) synthetase GluQRS [Burkholderiaceae bacterium]|nr:tRNA glutamyl-Q(34) synthetase GluQRS [Burkholderiaceae bacterium]
MSTSSVHSRSRAETYRGRFAPSPTGPLHAGSLVAALASWLDARAHGGVWLVRIEDLDPPREVAGAAGDMLATLAEFGMESDEPVLFQSERGAHYQAAFDRLSEARRIYACACSRSDVDLAIAAGATARGVYPGTCRNGTAGRAPRAWRFRVPAEPVEFVDRSAGRIRESLEQTTGDFIVRRADGLWAYQLAVVVDDAAQRITDVVRGADLLDNTARQIALQRTLSLPTPRYLHVAVVVNDRGEKLSKQTGARALDRADPCAELERAATHLGLPLLGARDVDAFLDAATRAWGEHLEALEKPA